MLLICDTVTSLLDVSFIFLMFRERVCVAHVIRHLLHCSDRPQHCHHRLWSTWLASLCLLVMNKLNKLLELKSKKKSCPALLASNGPTYGQPTQGSRHFRKKERGQHVRKKKKLSSYPENKSVWALSSFTQNKSSFLRGCRFSSASSKRTFRSKPATAWTTIACGRWKLTWDWKWAV